MKATALALDGATVLEPKVFEDARGFFLESFNQRVFEAATGCVAQFVQDNHSRSTRGVLRGLHYQLPPSEQGKLVRVTQGTVFDVIVDIRRSSPTFGQWLGIELSADNKKMLWVGPGLAHGFLVLSDSAEVQYKTTSYYAPADERSIAWNDPDIRIAWPMLDVPFTVSAKDAAALALARAELFG